MANNNPWAPVRGAFDSYLNDQSTPTGWGAYLEAEPRAAYYSTQAWEQPEGFATRGQPARTWYQGQFGDVYNQYLGALGSQVRGGGAPSLSWADYLNNIPFTQRYAALSPEMAGRGVRRFSPGTRQIYF
jgi:hypothetical protein